MDVEVIKSYLVSLGFSVDHPQLRKFEDGLRAAGQQVERISSGMVKQFTVAGSAIVGALTGIATGALAIADNAASADLSFQLFARRMYMGADAARSMKIAADALGVSIEDIVWGPKELQERYSKLVDEQRRIEGGFGGGTADRLRQIRDLRFEFTRLEVAATELSRGFAVKLFDKLFGDGQAQKKLQSFVEWIITNIPHIADELATALAPTLKNIFEIWRELADIVKTVTSDVLQFVGAIYGDGQLSRGEVTIKNIGLALEYISGTVKTIIGYVDWLINAISAHPIIAKMLGGAAAGAAGASVIPGVGTGTGALVGGALGFSAGVGDALGVYSRTDEEKRAIWRHLFGGESPGSTPSLADRARKVAAEISGATGIPANLLFGQFAHETGNFTNRGATQLDNLAGIRSPGGGDYRQFSTLEDFATYYEKLIQSSRYSRALGAKTPEDFAAALKSGGYYEDSYANYAAGIRRYAPTYQPNSAAASSQVDVGGVTVNISQPNATPEQIHHAVTTAVSQALDKNVARTTLQLSGAYA